MDPRLIGLLLLVTGIADLFLARRMQHLAGSARTMLYIFGGAFMALGVMMLLGGQKAP